MVPNYQSNNICPWLMPRLKEKIFITLLVHSFLSLRHFLQHSHPLGPVSRKPPKLFGPVKPFSSSVSKNG